jgi:hypothetical protein
MTATDFQVKGQTGHEYNDHSTSWEPFAWWTLNLIPWHISKNKWPLLTLRCIALFNVAWWGIWCFTNISCLLADESRNKPPGPGFYQDQYSTAEEIAAQTMHAMSNQSRSSTAAITTTAAAGLFEPHTQSTVNYALKPEKGLPPTPPGKLWKFWVVGF